MWYLKVSSSLLIAVALICMIQNAISLTLDQTTEDQWSKLTSSTDQIDLKKILNLCKNSINSFNEKLENTKTIVNKKLPEPNKTTEDIENLVSDVKTQIKNSSADLVTVRKLVQKTALRFRDTFKSLASFTELDNESVNKELESIKKTTVDGKKPLVNRVVRSFGNRYDLNKLANKVLEISADREKLKNNYDEKKKIAKKELNSLWNSLTYHSKTVNDNALKAFEIFFEGMKSLKSVKKKIKTIGEDAINEIKKGDDFNKLKNAVELAKALKLKFEDEWNLDSGELSYSEEQKKDTTKTPDENPIEDNEYNNSINNIEPSLPTTEQATIDSEKINAIPSTQVEIEKPSKDDSLTSDKAVSEVEEKQLPTESENKFQTTKLQPTIKDDLPDENISDNVNSPIEETSIIPNTENKENKEKIIMVEPKVSNNETNPTDGIKSDLSNNETIFNPDITNDKTLISTNKNAVNNKKNKIITKRTSREKIPILPWQKLIQLDDPQVSQQSKKCESLLNNLTPDFDNIKKSAKNSIQVTKNYKTLQKIENDTVQRFYDKMVDTNTKLSDYLVNSAENVCAKVTPINKRYETKFKNDPNIKRIKYLLGKQYDPNQYILKILDDASHKNGIGGMKKTTYYKMLAVAHNLNHETKEMEDVALYAMNKIYEGKSAATNLQKMFNKEKASKACYIRNILLEKENDADKKKKDENKEKVKESINNETNKEPLKPDVNLDSVDDIQPSTINDDNEPTLNIDEEKKTLSDTNESTTHNNQGTHENDNTTDEKDNTKKENEEQKTEENDNISSIQKNKGNDTTTQTKNGGANTAKRNITRKVTHHRKHRNPNNPDDVSEEYDTIEEIEDEEDFTNEYQSSEKKSNIIPEAESLVNSDHKHEDAEPEHSENENVKSNVENSSSEDTSDGDKSGESKTKRRRKRIVPKDGKEISEKSEEEDGNKLNNSGEKTVADTQKSEAPITANNRDDAESPEHLENENVESNVENSSSADTSDGDKSGESKTKRRRKRIVPKDGKEISEKSEEEDGNKLNNSGEKTVADTQKSEAPITANNRDDAESPEHLENENVESNVENSSSADTSDGDKSGESKTKRRRKRIVPKDGKEISEKSDEEDGNKLNNSGEKTVDDTQKSEAPITANNRDDAESPEHLENENVESNVENSSSADTSDGDKSGESKTNRHRKRIVPKDGKEISEKSEEEDGNKLNNSGEKTVADTQKSEAPITANNRDDAESPEHLENENVESNVENSSSADTSDGDKSGESKTKRRRKRIVPKDGKEISEKSEEEDGNKLNNSGEKTVADTQKSEAPTTANNRDDAESPEHLENENVESNVENSSSADTSDGDKSGESKTKRRRKRIVPKDGKEISEKSDEEDGNKLNNSGEKTVDDTQKSEAPITANNRDDAESPEHLENENVESNVENSSSADTSDGDKSGESKTKRRRKRIVPKDGKEISEKSDEEDGNKLNNSGEKTVDDTQKSEAPITANNRDDAESPEHLENENVESNVENSSSADTSDGDKSGESKTKRRRKRIVPKDGKEISEKSEEEEGNKLNNSGEKTVADTQKSEAPITANNRDDAESPEHLENENVESNVENSSSADTSDGDKSGESKTKRRRKRIVPKDGKEISEKSDEEDGNKLNNSGEKTVADTQKSEAPITANNRDDAESPEHLENENVESNVENSSSADTSDGDKSGESKTKRRRKRIVPKDGKEISEKSDEEDGNKLNNSGEKTVDDTQKSEAPITANNRDDAESPEHLENENVESNVENSSSADTSDGDKSGESKTKRRRKRIVPKDGKEISEKSEEEDGNKLNKSREKQTTDTSEIETPVNEENNTEQETEEEDTNTDITSVNGDLTKENLSEASKSSDEYDEKIDQENTTNETEDLDENENLNSVEEAELKSVNNEKITPAAESMGEDSTSYESSYESPEKSKLDTPSESQENTEDEPMSEKTKLDESPEYNQSNEHEPETPTDEVVNKSSEIDEQHEGVDQPTIKNRRLRRPKNKKNGLELPEDDETDKKQNDESPADGNEIDIPSEAQENTEDEPMSEIPKHYESPEYNQSTEHEPETPTDEVVKKSSEIDEQPEGVDQPTIKNRRLRRPKNKKNGLELPEDDETDKKQNDESPADGNEIDTPSEAQENTEDEPMSEIPKHDESPEYNQSNEHETETPTDEVVDKSSEIDEQPEGVDQPTIKNRRLRRPKNKKNGLELREDDETDKKQNDESPADVNEIDTPSEAQENTEDEPMSEIPKPDENPEYNQSNEHETETPTNEVVDKSSDNGEQDERNNQPNKRYSRRRGPKSHLGVSEEYDTLEEVDEESPLEHSKKDTPEYDENSRYKQSNEHEPETPNDKVVDNSSEIDEQPEGVDQPTIKNRRLRRPKNKKNGLELPEDDETDKKQNDESPADGNEIDTPSEAQENTEDEPMSEIPKHDESPEYNQSNEHEPETPTDEVVDNSSEIDEQPEGVDQPTIKNRRLRRPKNKKNGLELPEDDETDKKQNDESPADGNEIDTPSEAQENTEDEPMSEIPKHDESPEYNQSNEHEPETPTDEVVNKSSEIDEQPEGVDQPTIKNRRLRRPKNKKNGLELPEKDEKDKKQNDESPADVNEIDTPSEAQENTEDEPMSEIPKSDENPEYYQSNEHETETPTNEVVDKSSDNGEQDERNNQPNKRYSRRRGPKSHLGVSEEYDTLEEVDEESPLEHSKKDTPEYDENSRYKQSNEHEPEKPTDEVVNKSSEIDEQHEGVDQPTIKNRRLRRPKNKKNGLELPEDDETDKKQNDESPADGNEIDIPSEAQENTEDEPMSEIPKHYESPEYNQSTEHEPETPTDEVVKKSSEIDEQPEGVDQPTIKNRRLRRPKNKKNGLELPEDDETDKKQNDESPADGNEIDTPSEAQENTEDEPMSEIPKHDESPEYNQSNEHETETPTDEVVDKSSEIDEQPEGVDQPTIKNRRLRRPKNKKNGLELPEDDETDKKQNDESPADVNEIDTPSEAQENTEDEPMSEIPKSDENPEYYQSNEHETETPTNEVVDKSSDNGEQDERNNQPNKRYSRRRGPKSHLGVSEEYDTLEEVDEESPLEHSKKDTPEYDENSRYKQSNEHEPEKPTDEVVDNSSEIDEQPEGVDQPNIKNRRLRRPKNKKNGLELPEDDETDKKQNDESPADGNEIDTPSEAQENTEDEPMSEIPKHDESPEYNQSNEHETETPTDEVVDKSSEIDEQPEGVDQPTIKNRRLRRPKNKKNGLELPEDDETDKKQNDESPADGNEIDTPSEAQENTEDEPMSEIPKHDESPEYNQSNEHETETPTDEVVDKSSEIDEQPEGVDQPTIKNRRLRRPKNKKNGLELPEDDETDKKQNDESPADGNEIDTPSEAQENTEDEPMSEIPKHDESPEYNQSNEHETETPTDEVVDKSSEIDEQPEGVDQPTIKNRRLRRPKNKKNGLELPEDDETDKKQNDESPADVNEIDTPSEAQENTEDEPMSEIPKPDENPEYNQSNEHETETPTNEVVDKSSDNGEQDERNNQPNKRYSRRRGPKSHLGVSEEYDTLEEVDEESPLEHSKKDTPEYDENSRYKQSNEHEPETPTDEVVDNSSEIDEQPEGVDQPTIKNRRLRRPKNKKNCLELPEDDETDKKQNDESPADGNEIDTPSEAQENTEDEPMSEIPKHDESPEYNQSNEHEPETPTDEVVNKSSEIDEQPEGVDQPTIKNRRLRRPKNKKNGLELPEDDETDKKQNDESPADVNEIDAPSEAQENTEDEPMSEIPKSDENPEYYQSNEHETETPTNEVVDKSSDNGEQDERNNQPNKRYSRRRGPKSHLGVSEEYDTLEEVDEESPLEHSKKDTPEYDENSRYKQSNEHEPETPTDEVVIKSSEIDEHPEGDDQPTIKNRRLRRPKNKNGLEVPEYDETDKEHNDESPAEDNEMDTPSEAQENTEDEPVSEITKPDEYPEYNLSNEHEPETPTDVVVDKSSEIDEQPEGVDHSTIKNRRQRRPKKPKNGIEVPEDYETDKKQNDESPAEDNEMDTSSEAQENTEDEPMSEIPKPDENPEYNQSNEHETKTPTNEVVDKSSDNGEQDERNNQPNKRYSRRRGPKSHLGVSEEYDTLEEVDEESPLEHSKKDTPEYDENSRYKQSNEHEPETPTDEVVDKSSEIDEQPEGVDHSTIKNRRQRRPKKPKNGLDVPEDDETDNEHNDESPAEDNEMDTPFEAQENTEDEPMSEITKPDENPEYNLSNEHEPETPTDVVVDNPSDIGEQDERNNQPNKRYSRRRGPKSHLGVSEEYDTLEEEDDESPLEHNKIDTPEYDENSRFKQSNEHEPETPTNELVDKSSYIGEEYDRNNQPNKRYSRRRGPKSRLGVSEEYDTFEEQDEESPLEVNKIDTPIYDENSKPELSENLVKLDLSSKDLSTPIDTDDNEIVAKPMPRKIRRRRKSIKPQSVGGNDKTPIEVNDENIYNYPVEDQDVNNNYIPYNNSYGQEEKSHNGYGENNDNESDKDQPELSEYPENSDLSSKESAIPIDTDDNVNVVKPHPRKIRRRRKSKQPKSVNGNDTTPMEVNDENINSYPVEDQYVNSNSIPYNDNDVNKEVLNNGYRETNDNESDKDQPELSEYPENSDLSSKDSAIPIDTDDNVNVVKPHPRKIRRRRKSKQPKSVNGNDTTPMEVNDENINSYPVEDQYVNSNSIPYNDNDVNKEVLNNGYRETNDNESDKDQPELSEYPENSDLSSKDSAIPIDTDDNVNVVKPHPRKIRRRRKSKQPKSVNGNDTTPMEVNDENINSYPVEDQYVNSNSIPYNDNDVNKEVLNNGYREKNDNESDKDQPELSEYPENLDLSSKDSAIPIDTDDNVNVVKPHLRKIRRRRKSKQPKSVNGNDTTPMEVNDENINSYPVEDQYVNSNSIPFNDNDVNKEVPNNGYRETNDNESDKDQPELSEYPENSDLSSKDSEIPIETDDNVNVVKPHPRKIRRRRKSKQPKSDNGNDKTPIEANDVSTKIIPTSVDAENSRVPNENKSTETLEIDTKNIQKNPKKKRRIRRIRTYVVNKATNERIPINDQTYSTTDGLPDAINNKLGSLETEYSDIDDPDSNTDDDDYSSFLFKEYNSDQCKRNAYDRFKKVTSEDAKQIAYRSVLDTSEMRSNMLATMQNAIGNVKASRTFNDVDQSLRTVSYSIKVGLKQTVSDLVIKVIPLAKNFLKTAENLKKLYQKGPQSTRKMLTNILENESTVPESANDILRLISPQFDVDELINNIFEKPFKAKSLKEKKVKAQRKLIDLSKHMDTLISNIDCFVLSAMSTIGIGADTLKLLKSGKVIMSDRHPRAKILKDAVGIIKAGKKIRNNDDSFTPTLTPSDGTTESDEDDDDEDPDKVAEKNEEFLKTVPNLDDNIPIPKKVRNKRQSLGVIVVHPDKQIEYKEVKDTSQLKKFVGDQTKKYKLQSINEHPKFLKLNSKQLIHAMVADVKKKAERNGMTKKEMVDEIINNLNST